MTTAAAVAAAAARGAATPVLKGWTTSRSDSRIDLELRRVARCHCLGPPVPMVLATHSFPPSATTGKRLGAVDLSTAGRSPVFSADQTIENMVDALPQAVVLTSIVIGLATTALLIALAMRIYEKYGTFDITKIRELRG